MEFALIPWIHPRHPGDKSDNRNYKMFLRKWFTGY